MNRMIRAFALPVLLLATLTTAGHHAHADGAPLFPLRPGSSWQYVRSSGGDDVFMEVLGPRKGGPGFVVQGYWGYFDIRALRGNQKDSVMEIRHDGSEGLYYMLAAPVGTSWTMQVEHVDCIDGVLATLAARDLTLTVPAGTFEGVVRVDYGFRCFDGGMKSEWFAPGIGLIQRTSDSLFGERTIKLLSATNVPGVQTP